MKFFKAKKRNWSFVTFDESKIESAIKKAIESVWWNDFSEVPALVKKVTKLLWKKVWESIPNVEDIQDSVEETLIKEW
jgi:hypothetical protein